MPSRVSSLAASASLIAAALTLTACLEETGTPVDASPTADASPDAGPCEGTDPSLGQCSGDEDCPDDQTCQLDPDACVPSACACTDDGWICTADCGPGRVCRPRACNPLPCDADDCCLPEGTCERDFDCPNGYCEVETGACRQPCGGDGAPAQCDAIEPVCGVGWTLVASNGCHGCVDARSCEGPAVDECGVVALGEGGCQGPDGAPRLAGCCQLDRWPVLIGRSEGTCAPDDGPARALTFGLGPLTCGEQSTVQLTVYLWGPELRLGGPIDVTGAGFMGSVQRCDWTGCELAEAGEIAFDDFDLSDDGGRLWFRFPSGASVEAVWLVEDCPSEPQCG